MNNINSSDKKGEKIKINVDTINKKMLEQKEEKKYGQGLRRTDGERALNKMVEKDKKIAKLERRVEMLEAEVKLLKELS